MANQIEKYNPANLTILKQINTFVMADLMGICACEHVNKDIFLDYRINNVSINSIEPYTQICLT